MTNDFFSTYVAGGAAGMYLLTTLFLGLEMEFDFLRLRNKPVTPLMRMGGMAFLSDFISIFCWGILSQFFDPTFWHRVSVTFDGITAVMFCLTGFTLLRGRYVTTKQVLTISCPLILVWIVAYAIPLSWAETTIISDVLLGITCFYLLRKMLRHDKRLKDVYSDTANRTKKWFSSYIAWFFINMPLYYVLYVKETLGSYGFFIYDITLIAFYVYLSKMMFKQEETAIIDDENSDETVDFSENRLMNLDGSGETARMIGSLPDDAKDRIGAGLKHIMEEEKMYLQPELSIKEVCYELATNSTYLYLYMRDVEHTRFYQYVNNYRINDAKRLLKDTDEKIEDIAFKCGFNSYNTFYSAFRQIAGTTPRAWRKEDQ